MFARDIYSSYYIISLALKYNYGILFIITYFYICNKIVYYIAINRNYTYKLQT